MIRNTKNVIDEGGAINDILRDVYHQGAELKKGHVTEWEFRMIVDSEELFSTTRFWVGSKEVELNRQIILGNE